MQSSVSCHLGGAKDCQNIFCFLFEPICMRNATLLGQKSKSKHNNNPGGSPHQLGTAQDHSLRAPQKIGPSEAIPKKFVVLRAKTHTQDLHGGRGSAPDPPWEFLG